MKYLNKSALLSAVILSSVITSGCTATQQKYAINGQQITVERKATNRAYVDQVKLIEQGSSTSVTGVATIQTSTRGSTTGNLYVDLIGFNNEVIRQVSEPYNRSARSKRQFTFSVDLGNVPKNVHKVVVYYAD